MTEPFWISPADALDRQKAGDLTLMPPTLKTIEELSAFSSIDDLFSFAESRQITPLLPQAFQTADGLGVKLPFDPEYTLPDYKLPVRPDGPSRIVLIDGKWKTMRFDG